MFVSDLTRKTTSLRVYTSSHITLASFDTDNKELRIEKSH